MGGVVVVNQPGVYFVDVDGNNLTADDGTTIASHEGLLVAGKDGTVMRFMRVASDGTLRIDPTGTTTQPISAAGLPLPAGAATQTTLATLATETKLEAVRVILASLDAKDYATQTTLATLATETKLEAVRVILASLDAKDYATQTTLAAILVDTGQMEVLLAGGLPAALVGGRLDSNLGAWLGSTAPTVGQKAMVASVPVTLASDQTTISVTSGASVSSGAVASFLLNGASNDLVVNGSGTPVEFKFDADATDDIQITSLRLVIAVGGSFDFNGDTFGDGGSALTNGVSIDIVADNGLFTQQLTNLTVNEDFARLLDFSFVTDIDSLITATLPFGGNVLLVGGSSDKISITVNDNVALGVRGIDYFTATVYGVVAV